MAIEEGTGSGGSVEGYVDIYLLPVPEKNLEPYWRQATTFGTVAKEYGALSYREFRGDDLDDKRKVPVELLTAAPNSSHGRIVTR
jgi:uncharacterized protein YbaA (DUF1428 family)